MAALDADPDVRVVVISGEGKHFSFGLDLMGMMAELGPPDLNILDCIWINANPYRGPATYYSDATRTDQLVASTDPVAADAVGAALLGRAVSDLPFITKAERIGGGTADYRSLDLKEIQVS